MGPTTGYSELGPFCPHFCYYFFLKSLFNFLFLSLFNFLFLALPHPVHSAHYKHDEYLLVMLNMLIMLSVIILSILTMSILSLTIPLQV